jgi:Tfp pilus assembly protein PilX
MSNLRTKQRGAALVMGLILLVVITLLAVVGMNIANTELASATSEQLSMRAFNAAETGLEARLQTLRTDANLAKTVADPEVRDPVAVENSPVNTATNAPTDTYGTTTIYRGEGSLISRFSAGTFHGFHFSVESTGRSARNALAVHTAGAFQINGTGGGGFVFTQNNDAPPVNTPPP